MLRTISYTLASLLLSFCLNACQSTKSDTLYQVSTIDALLAGVYDSEFSFADLQNYGDFGIGTFNELDGELIILEGEIYKISSDAQVHRVDPVEKTPFLTINKFKADLSFNLGVSDSQGGEGLKASQVLDDFASLVEMIDKQLARGGLLNYVQAVKVQGYFKHIKLRSVPKQEKPYRELKDVVAEQSVFDYENISGTLVGYRNPEYMKGLNVPGYHFHFLSDDKTRGGHLLAFAELHKALVEIDTLHRFELILPENDNFRQVGLSKDRSLELKKVEQ